MLRKEINKSLNRQIDKKRVLNYPEYANVQ